MQPRIPQHQENAAHDPQTQHIIPESQDVEAETAQDRAAGDFDVEAVFFVDEREVADFVYDQAFEAEVEDGEL